jgi:hypothetical protein
VLTGARANAILLLSLVACLALKPVGHSLAADSVKADPSDIALIRLSVDYIDSVLHAVAASTDAIADEFARVSQAVPSVSSAQEAFWREHNLAQDRTVSFQTWDGALDSPPAYQSESPAFFSYGDKGFSTQTFQTLEVFNSLTPVVRAAYRSYPYSWSYVTTAEGMMMIYPFLTLDEAVNNNPPTEQTYYRHADFGNRSAGWTPPYLDLVGAGMMVTASTPAYDGDTLLGVVSHDITLAQLSESVLGLLTRDVGGIAWLVDRNGLVIAVSESSLEKELDDTNQSAGEAVLHYRSATPQGDKAKTSQTAWINEVTAEMLSHAESTPPNEVIHSESESHPVLGGRVESTGWLLIWKAPGN